MQEQTIIVDGKEIKESEMPKDCFLIQGKWYTEKGLPKELVSYKRLWTDAKSTKQLGTTDEKGKKEELKKTTTPPGRVPTEQAPPEPPSDPTNTAQPANTTPEKQ